MSTAQANSTRPYLTRELRRNTLLVTATGIVEKQGWNALTMISLAREAHVSRQLVYQHFESVDTLLIATLTYIFQDVYERTRAEVANSKQGDIVETVSAMQRITFDIPAGRARALWQAMSASGTSVADGELSNLSRRLRHLLMKMVQPLLEQRLGLPSEAARPLTWMMIVAFWGARQITEDGELDRDAAMQLYDWLIDCFAHGSRNRPPPTLVSPRTTRKRA